MQNKKEIILGLVRYCHYCQPMSGCILSDLCGKGADEILSHLNGLSEKMINRIISFHEACPYSNKVPI